MKLIPEEANAYISLYEMTTYVRSII